ncbi:MAG: hypothetical protein KA923_04155, partial [Opitutaceae bacterium]|nr:hypothetical protein [Opitutaceae bacterium]
MASNSHPSPRAHSILRLRQLFFAAVLFAASPAFAADESCHTCGGAVSVSGDFAHHKSETTPAFSESGFKPEAYREEVH